MPKPKFGNLVADENTSASQVAGRSVLVVQSGLDVGALEYAAIELKMLATSAGGKVMGCHKLRVPRPTSATYFRSGQVERLRELATEVDVVVFSQELTPRQERNLKKALDCEVINKVALILDIFAQRAQSYEGKLQVELARLHHKRTRLVRGWTHLERQKGGFGMHGPGESQLEIDRRLLQNRIRRLEKKVSKVCDQRERARYSRQKARLPSVVLVGYTNAGKSTLFKAISEDQTVYCADKPFATLDPTVRRLNIPGIGSVAIIDTVGFISDLPHHLIHAFRATLEEVRQADVLLHVIDGAHGDMEQCLVQVEKTLTSLEAQDIERIEVYNKCDISPQVVDDSPEGARVTRVSVSALTGAGIDHLLKMIRLALQKKEMVRGWYHIHPSHLSLRADLHSIAAIEHEEFNPDGSVDVKIQLTKMAWERFMRIHQAPVHLLTALA